MGRGLDDVGRVGRLDNVGEVGRGLDDVGGDGEGVR